AWLLLAGALIRQNSILPGHRRSWKEAETALVKAETDAAQAVLVALWRAELQWHSGNPGKARSVLEQARRKHPEDATLIQALVDLATRQKDTATAAKVLEEAERTLGDHLDWQLQRTAILVRQGGPKAVQALARLEARAVKAGSDD